MRKNIITSVIITLVILSLAGCSEKNEPAVVEVGKKIGEDNQSDDYDISAKDEKREPDCKELALSLLNGIKYDDELAEVDLDTAKMFLNIEGIDISECCIYESSGATAEEIAVIKCADSESAANVKEAFNQRVNEQIENFTDYVPSEVPKLKDAIMITSKDYAILSVSGEGSRAKTIIEDAFVK